MSYCDYLENKILDHIFGGGDFARPATLYVGLCSSITDAGAITGEPSGSGYARVAVTNNATNWPAASGGAKSNGTAITFPKATGSWGTLSAAFISDAASGGNILLWASLGGSIVPDTDDVVTIAAGDFDISQT